ncbi:MAG: sigma-70 family RNA polymerase sigma factor [Myxococcota bacterium]|nr:sigma-70 family RNA polymerase sigma factor [Myxococcota bacterium]
MSLPPTTLFAALQRGEPRALDRLIEAWLPVTVAWCGRLGGARLNREDVASDVFMVVMNRHHKVTVPEKFPSWLYSVCRNLVRRHQRKAWLRRWVPGEVPDTADPVSTARVEMSDTARWVWEVLDELPLTQREVLILCDLEGRTREEAAELLGVSSGTIKGRMRLGREKFRRLARSRGDIREAAEVG